MADAPATATPAPSATPEAAPETPETPETPELGDAGKAALDAERRARKDAEKAAKAATAELEKLRQATATDQEKAVMAAKAEGRTEALREAGTRLVDAEVRAAAAGRNVDTEALLEGLDRTKFLDDEGSPDRAAIVAWIDKVAPAGQEPQPGDGFPDLGQGTRTPGPAGLGSNQLVDDLKTKLGIR